MSYNEKQLKLVPTNELLAAHPLLGLVENRCVVIPIHDKKTRLKKRVQNPILMISPVSIYGMNEGTFLFSIPGYGSEIVDLYKIKPLLLYRVGMTMKAATLLTKEINTLIKYNRQEK